VQGRITCFVGAGQLKSGTTGRVRWADDGTCAERAQLAQTNTVIAECSGSISITSSN